MPLKKWQRWGMLTMAVVQLGVLAGMVAIHERALRQGTAYRVRCEPRDPIDLFRGRYLDISLPPLPAIRDHSESVLDRTKYAQISRNADGFMQVGHIYAEPPSKGEYVAGRVQSGLTKEHAIGFQLPFDRYYVPEEKAAAIERAFRAKPENSYLVLRVYRGFAAVEKLVISGQEYY